MVVAMSLFLSGCMGMPKAVKPVNGFDLNRYLGTWYEIARLNHSFERGLNNVTAEYSMRDDGGVKVVNKGFSIADSRWKEAEGKAYFVGGHDEGYLKVSFFGPFYGSYIVFELDKENYQYAFLSGNTTSYLWFLSRTPTVSKELMDRFVRISKDLGFNTDSLVYVEHKQLPDRN
jgi:apolipoprotein D and lipocalin family protein